MEKYFLVFGHCGRCRPDTFNLVSPSNVSRPHDGLTHISFLPETLRSLVGDGSIPPPSLSASPVELYQRRKLAKKMAETGEELEPVHRPPPKPYRPFSTFAILLVPEIFLAFFFASLLYLQFYASLTLFSTALKNSYGLSELKIGLCYLYVPFSCGFPPKVNVFPAHRV